MVKLLDFGVAGTISPKEGDPLTQAGLLIGTPSHIAPELIETRMPASPESDLYSLGVTAYRVLSGNLPFVGETLFAQLSAACNQTAPPLDDPDLDIPLELQHLIASLLSKGPAKRPSDARQLAARLRLVAGNRPRTPLPMDVAASRLSDPCTGPKPRVVPHARVASEHPARREPARPPRAALEEVTTDHAEDGTTAGKRVPQRSTLIFLFVAVFALSSLILLATAP